MADIVRLAASPSESKRSNSHHGGLRTLEESELRKGGGVGSVFGGLLGGAPIMRGGAAYSDRSSVRQDFFSARTVSQRLPRTVQQSSHDNFGGHCAVVWRT